MRRVLLALALLASLLPCRPAAAGLSGPVVAVRNGNSSPATQFVATDRMGLFMEVTSDGQTAGTIVFTFTITDPAGSTVFSQTGNSAPASVSGLTGASIANIPISRFYTKTGQYILTGTAKIGTSVTATNTLPFTIRDAKIILQEPADMTEVSGTPLRFRWDTGASRYRLKVAEDSAFNRLKIDQETTQTLVDILQDQTTPPQNRLAGGTIYYWTVEGLDASGNVIARPDTYREFKIKAGSSPNARSVSIVDMRVANSNGGRPDVAPNFLIDLSVKNEGGQPEDAIEASCSAGGVRIVDETMNKTGRMSPGDPAAQLVFRLPDGLKGPVSLNCFLKGLPSEVQGVHTKTISHDFGGTAAAAGSCSPNPCQNGSFCSDNTGSAVCTCVEHSFGSRCEMCAAGYSSFGGKCVAADSQPQLPGKLEVTKVERQPVPAQWVEDPNASGANATVKVTLTNNLGSAKGPIVVTLESVAGTPGTPPSATVDLLASGNTRVVDFTVPFREPSPNATADYVASWAVKGEPDLSGVKTEALDIPRRRSPSTAVEPGVDLALTYAGQEDGPAGADFVPVKFIVQNKGSRAASATVRLKRLAGEESLAPDSADLSLGIEAGLDSYSGTFQVPKAKLGTGDVEAVVSVTGTGTEANGEDNYRRLTLHVTARAASPVTIQCLGLADSASGGFDRDLTGLLKNSSDANQTVTLNLAPSMTGAGTLTRGDKLSQLQTVNLGPKEEKGFSWKAFGLAGETGTVMTFTVRGQDQNGGAVAASVVKANFENHKMKPVSCAAPAAQAASTAEKPATPAATWTLAAAATAAGEESQDVTADVSLTSGKAEGVYKVQLLLWVANAETKKYSLDKTFTPRFSSALDLSSEKKAWKVAFAGVPVPKQDGIQRQLRAYLQKEPSADVLARGITDVVYPAPAQAAWTLTLSAAAAGSASQDVAADVSLTSGKPEGSYKVQLLLWTSDMGTITYALDSAFKPRFSETLDLSGGKKAWKLAFKGVPVPKDDGTRRQWRAHLQAQADLKDVKAQASADVVYPDPNAPEALVPVADPLPDLQVVLEDLDVQASGDKFELRGNVVVHNHGQAPAQSYRLDYSITTANKPASAGPSVAEQPLEARASAEPVSQVILTALDRDPVENQDTVTATVTLLDEQGRPVKDADPGNDTFTLKFGGPAAAQALASAPDLQVVQVDKAKVESVDGALTLKADVTVKNTGRVNAARYKLQYALTAAGKSVKGEQEVADQPLGEDASADLKDQTMLTKLPDDPLKTGGVLTATVVLLDNQGRPGRDADPGNNSFKLKLVGEALPAPSRGIAVQDVSIGEPSGTHDFSVPVTVTVVNNGPNAEPKITVRLVPTTEYPAALLESKEIKDLRGNGNTARVTIYVNPLDVATTLKFRAQLSVEPADPALTDLQSEEKSLNLRSAWILETEAPNLQRYFDTPAEKSTEKLTALQEGLGGDNYKVKVTARYAARAAFQGTRRLILSGLGLPRTGEALDPSADPLTWTQSFPIDFPDDGDQDVRWRAAVVGGDDREFSVVELSAKMPGNPLSGLDWGGRWLVHDLKLTEFKLGKGAGANIGDPSAGPVAVQVKIENAYGKEKDATITFAVEGEEIKTLALPALGYGGSGSVFNFHLPWRRGKKLKATVNTGSKDETPENNWREIDMPKRDLAVAEVALVLGPNGKPTFNQAGQGWEARIAVENLGGLAETVGPPTLGMQGVKGPVRLKPTQEGSVLIRTGEKAHWTVLVPPDTDDGAVVVAMLEEKDDDSTNNSKALALKFPPKPPRLDLGIQSVTARPDRIDFKALTIQLEVAVKNTGEGETSPMTVYLRGPGGTSAGPGKVPDLEKGQQALVPISYPLKEAAQEITARLDVPASNLDADSKNNEAAGTVPPLPWDLSVGDVTLGAVDKDKDTIPVIVKVHNAGNAAVKGRQVSVKLGGKEYVADPSRPRLDPRKSDDYSVDVRLPARGGPATLTALVLGSLEGELTPADNQKTVNVTLPDKPLWDLAVSEVVVPAPQWMDLSYPAFLTLVSVTNRGVRTEEGPTVSLSLDGKEVAAPQKVPKKLEPGVSQVLTFFVPQTFTFGQRDAQVRAALVDHKDDNAQNDHFDAKMSLAGRDLSIKALQMGEGMLLLAPNTVRIPVTVEVGKASSLPDKSFEIVLKAGDKEQRRKITDGTLSAAFDVDAKWGESVTVTATVVAERDYNPDNNVRVRSLSIPNPPIALRTFVHDPTVNNNCFIVFPTFAPGFVRTGYGASLEGHGKKIDGPMNDAPGWPMNAHLYPNLGVEGPWSFTLKVTRDGKVVHEQAVSASRNPWRQGDEAVSLDVLKARTERNYKVASVTGPTDAEIAAQFAKGEERRKVPFKVALERTAGESFIGEIPVRVRENGAAVVQDFKVSVGADGRGSASFDLPLLRTRGARTLAFTMVGFYDANAEDDTLTAVFSNIPAQPVFDVTVASLELGEFKGGKAPVKVTVTNLGDRDEKDMLVRLAWNDVSRGGDDKRIPSLGPQKSAVLDYEVTKPAGGKNRLYAALRDFQDDDSSNNVKWVPLKPGWDFKVHAPRMQAEAPSQAKARFTVPIKKVSGTYPSKELPLIVEVPFRKVNLQVMAKPTASGDFEAEFDVALDKDKSWKNVDMSVAMAEDDDAPSDNSAAVTVDLPGAPQAELFAGLMELTRKEAYYEVKVPIGSQSDFEEKNVKIRLTMDGHIIDPDQVIASIPKGGTASGTFRIPAHTPGNYEILGLIVDRPDLFPKNNTSTLKLTVTADPNYKPPTPPTTVLNATLSPASPRPGADFKLTCKGLPEGAQYKAELINKNPSPYQLNQPGFQIKHGGYSKTITTYIKLNFGRPSLSGGSLSKFDLVMSAGVAAAKAIAEGKSFGEVLKASVTSTLATALGEDASKLVGLEGVEVGSNDWKSMVTGAVSAAVKTAAQGGNLKDVTKNAAKGAVQTALGKTLTEMVGMDHDKDVAKVVEFAGKVMDDEAEWNTMTAQGSDDDDEEEKNPSEKVEVGPDEVTFALNQGTPPGSYVMRLRIAGKEDTACEAPFTVN